MPEKIVFILSTGRTGTKALAEGLADEETMSAHQPPFSRLLTIASNYTVAGWLPRDVLERLVFLIRGPQILHAACRYYIQAFALDHLPAKIFSETYPNVHILHIVRDPRTFVPSYLNWIKTRKRSFVANRLIPGWHPSGYLTHEFSFQKWMRMQPYQRICWHWAYKNNALEIAFRGSKQYSRLLFEQLFSARGPEVLEGALANAGIPFKGSYNRVFAGKKNESRNQTRLAWSRWSNAAKEDLLHLCGGLMERYGYR
jgi:hypothetical protein